MTITALDLCDAYVRREKGPPGRAQVQAIADRNRFLERAHDDACGRERAALAVVGDLQVTLESAYAEIAYVRDQLEQRASQAHAAHDALNAFRRRVQELETAAQPCDERLRGMTAPPAAVSLINIAGLALLAAWGGWLARG